MNNIQEIQNFTVKVVFYQRTKSGFLFQPQSFIISTLQLCDLQDAVFNRLSAIILSALLLLLAVIKLFFYRSVSFLMAVLLPEFITCITVLLTLLS